MPITLYLMTQKGYCVLKSLINNEYLNMISEVIIGEDKNIENDFSNEILKLCLENNISFYFRKDIYLTTSIYSIAVSWRWIITSESKLIVLHDSLLPKYRGFSPLVNMLINKEENIGVTALFATEEYDKGDIIFQLNTSIKYPIKIAQAIDLISVNYSDIVLKIFKLLEMGKKLPSFKQNDDLASYSLWRNDEDYSINWNDSSENIINYINALSHPYKGASSFINKSIKIRILDAEIEKDVKIENRDVGKVIYVKNNLPIIVCGKGLIKLKNIIADDTKENLLPLKNFRIKLT